MRKPDLSRCHALFVLAFSALFLSPEREAFAGCQINVYVKNTGDVPIDVQNSTAGPGELSSVKIKMGTWKSLRHSWFPSLVAVRLDPGQTRGDNYTADFNCGAKRRYKLVYLCSEGPFAGSLFTKYYPSDDDWTERQNLTVNLGRCKD